MLEFPAEPAETMMGRVGRLHSATTLTKAGDYSTASVKTTTVNLHLTRLLSLSPLSVEGEGTVNLTDSSVGLSN